MAFSSILIVFGGWMLYSGRSRPPVPVAETAGVVAAQAPSGSPTDDGQQVSRARRATLEFPADPEIWRITAQELLPTDADTARQLLENAMEADPDNTDPSLVEDGAEACLAAGDSHRALELLGRLAPPAAVTARARILRNAALIGLGEAPEGAPASQGDEDLFIREGARVMAPGKLAIEAAITACERIAAMPGPFQRDALRLLARCRWHTDPGDAVFSAEKAAEFTQEIADWRFLSGALRRAGRDSSGCEARLAVLGSASPVAALEYTGWLMAQHQSGAALAWLGRQPSALAGDARIAERRALLLLANGNEPDFEAALLAGAWGSVNPDAAQLAFTARLSWESKRDNLAADLWRQALSACRTDRDSLRVLTRLAMAWNRAAETEEGFEALLARDPLDLSTARRFVAWAGRQADSSLVQAAALAWRKADPTSDDARDLWARTALAREDGAALADAAAVAEDLASRDARGLVLLALARHRQGRNDEAISILEKLPPERLAEPRPALYYGLLLATADPARAARYLDYAARGVDFLPEEKLMLNQARAVTTARGDLSNQ